MRKAESIVNTAVGLLKFSRRKMVKKTAKRLVPTDIPESLRPGKTIPLPGRILVSPQGTLIWERKKKAIVSSRKTEKYIGIPIYLIEDDKALGIIELKKPRKINLQEFKELRKYHKISDKEYKKWWASKKFLYYYPIELISKFEPTKEILRPTGSRVWLESVTFKSLDMVNPSGMTDEELIEVHEKLHKMWREAAGSKEDIMNYHILIRKELLSRKLKYGNIDELDKKSMEFQERFSKSGYKLTFYGTKGLVKEEGLGHRFHTSILYEFQGKKLLVDYGKTNQGNLAKIKPDYILVSHSHPDSIGGLQDSSIIVSKEIVKEIPELYKDFNINAKAEYEPYKTFRLGSFKITPIPVLHSIRAKMHVFLIQMGNKKVLQATDILSWHSGDREKYVKGLDLAIIDGSSLTKTLTKGKSGESYGHSSVANQLKNWYSPKNVKRVIVTHLGKEPLSLGDNELLAKIKEMTKVPVAIATDNTVINLGENLAPIYTSGKVMGRPIFLKDVLPYFKNFIIQKPLIYLTGGLVNRGSTRSGVDILMPNWLSSDTRRIIEFRISRSVPWHVRRRLHFVYDKFSTPFTNAIPLYNLTILRNKDKMMRLSEIFMNPFPNEHACRLHPPKDYDRFFRQNCKIKHNGKCIHLIFGVKEGKSEIQTMRYSIDTWTVSEARSHCKSKKGMFEPAKIEKKLNQDANWAKVAYRYVLSQQQMTLWVKTLPSEKARRVRDAMENFKKLHPFKLEWTDNVVSWLELRPNEIKGLMISQLEMKKSRKVPPIL